MKRRSTERIQLLKESSGFVCLLSELGSTVSVLMAAVDGREREPHVVVFPFPTQGHLSPAMDLAHRLGASGILVTIVHTPGNLAALLQQRHNPNGNIAAAATNGDIASSPYVHMEALDLDSEVEKKLPASAPLPQVFETLDTLSEPLQRLILKINSRPGCSAVSCIASDSFLPWTLDVANKLGIPRVEIWTSSVSGYLLGFYLPQFISRGYLPFKQGTEDSVVDFVPGISSTFRLGDLAADMLVRHSSHPVFQFLSRAFGRAKQARRVLVNSFHELEASAVAALQAENVVVTPIGPLLPAHEQPAYSNGSRRISSLMAEDLDCLKWLDAQKTASVLYVSFGSAAFLCAQEIRELALGLEAAQQPFLWALSGSGSGPTVLPEGFQSRTKQRGLLVSWAPQLAVLAHPSVGGFLSHCGWNSVLESLWMGVPIIGCPRVAEQNTNLWLIKEWGVGAAAIVGGGHQKEAAVRGVATLHKEGVERAVRALMQGGGGGASRRRAQEIKVSARKALAEQGSSTASFQQFVDDLKTI